MPKVWSKWVEEAGLRARLFRWGDRPAFYYDWTDPLSGNRVRKSTKRTTRKAAEDFVKEVLEELAREGEGRTLGQRVDLGTVFRLFFEHKVLHYRADYQRACHTRRALFERAWGVRKIVMDLDQSDLDEFKDLRSTGKLVPAKSRLTEGVRLGTIQADLRWLSVAFNWALGHKVSGRKLLPSNPLVGLKRPEERNVRRPIASHDRFLKTLETADDVDQTGRLGCMLALARYTGRRENAICCLRANDFLRTADSVRDALAAMGSDETSAQHFPHGGLRWRAESDKGRRNTITPLSASARRALDAYLERNPRVGDVPLFPSPEDDSRPIRKDRAGVWLLRAETKAKLPKLSGGRWHPYRRLFATERKSVPVQDVAAAGGWKSIETVQRLYQQAEAKGVLEAVERISHG
ncbi:MAG: tyrosine-type recombinase/integrase [Longimicrobiales bacterium]